MKFYIPTSSLNIDNILQSECILPISHYVQRLSGYKSYEQIDELRPFNAIVLFKYPVRFSINDEERYNFPVLIEFEDDAQTMDFCENEIQNGVCVCSHVLNLTPTNCRIFFFSKRAYDITSINTQSNKSIKFYKEYSIFSDTTMLELRPLPTLVSPISCDVGVCEDGIIDKKKGVLYAYLLGGLKSVSHNLAVQLRLEQELYNVLTSLGANPSSKKFFGDKLSLLLDEYKKIDEIEKKSLELFESNFKKELDKFYFLKGCLIEFLSHIGCWDYVFEVLCKRWGCSFIPTIAKLNTETDFMELRSEIEKRINRIVGDYQKKHCLSTLNDISIKGNVVVLADVSLVNAVISYIINQEKTSQALCANRMDFYMGAMNVVVPILKEQIGEANWGKSKEREYINSLHAFIKDPAFHFELNSIDDIQLKSIAAFILNLSSG